MTRESAWLDDDELLHLALNAAQQDQNEQAIKLLKRLLDRNPAHGRARYMLGAMHAEIGMYERAIDDMRAAVELEPELPTAHFQLGLLLLTSGRVAEAEDAWLPLDELSEDDPLFLFKRGMLNLARNEFEACIADLERGISLNRQNEDLNDDMRGIIASARQALAGSAPAPADSGVASLAAYRRGDLRDS